MASILSNILNLTLKKLFALIVIVGGISLLTWIAFFESKKYSFEHDQLFPIHRWTKNLGVDYYVKEHFIIEESQIPELEVSIEKEHFKYLDRMCNNDIWSYRKQKNPHKPPSCEKLKYDFKHLSRRCTEELTERAILAKEAEEKHGWKSVEYQTLVEKKLPSCLIKNEIVERYKVQGDFADPAQKVDEYKSF